MPVLEWMKQVQTWQRLARVRERTEQAGLLRCLSGGAAKDREELAAKRLQLADVEQRTAEQLGAITAARDRAAADLAARHARRDELARQVIAERRLAFYADEPGIEAGRGGLVGGRSRNDEGGRERVYYRTHPTTPVRA